MIEVEGELDTIVHHLLSPANHRFAHIGEGRLRVVDVDPVKGFASASTSSTRRSQPRPNVSNVPSWR
ncbi:hypothetical protein RCO27_16165 [Sphingosinicella sp. LHD-64]|uniref:hypothetical protein n=1 Tax=Sphingosinicella sp. LHD-64 TaxID=3072139 RepID=UPI00280D4148|nr:hypothetical protein [Sphingosinicella sp. LHD-64]MDQ8757763.1 hypothetical protein [Sphingosinicella sp. LHD-64]